MTGSPSRLQHLFIVRTWREPSDVVDTGEWRGLVEHVASGQRRYFTRMEDLDKFILHQMDHTPAISESPDQPG
jgi:hypothetical protein